MSLVAYDIPEDHSVYIFCILSWLSQKLNRPTLGFNKISIELITMDSDGLPKITTYLGTNQKSADRFAEVQSCQTIYRDR